MLGSLFRVITQQVLNLPSQLIKESTYLVPTTLIILHSSPPILKFK